MWEFVPTAETRAAVVGAVRLAARHTRSIGERIVREPELRKQEEHLLVFLEEDERRIVDGLMAVASSGGWDQARSAWEYLVVPVMDGVGRLGMLGGRLLDPEVVGSLSPAALTLVHWVLRMSDAEEPRPSRRTAWERARFAQVLTSTRGGDGARPPLGDLVTLMDELGQRSAPSFNGVCVLLDLKEVDEWPAEEIAQVSSRWSARLAEGVGRGFPGVLRRLRSATAWDGSVEETLVAVALTGRRADRCPTQDVLDSRGADHRHRIVAALDDRAAAVRLEAARWLHRSPGDDAVPALEKAFAKEKQENVAGALLDALVAAGGSVRDYLGVSTLEERARAVLAKGLPKELAWVDWETMPEVRWADGDLVPPVVLQWLMVVAVRSGSPEPGASARAHAGLMNRSDAQELGLWLLAGWLAADVAPLDPAIAAKEAHTRAALEVQHLARDPERFARHPRFGWTQEQVAAHLLEQILSVPDGSEVGSKGVLGLVAATATTGVAALTSAYLTRWFGTRAAQGKALIAMLGWVDDRSATTLLLQVGSRFRTRSFSVEARRAADALAERQGWTVAELADRSVPMAGTDDSGTLELSYGPRSFTARIDDTVTFILTDEEGRVIRSLPPGRASDDREAVTAAKGAFSRAKKELKEAAASTPSRLYEAMVAGRSWSGADWRAYFLGHPVVGKLVPRVVWVLVNAGGARLVRPLLDGTVTDVDDERVEVADDDRLAVAHSSAMSEAEVRAWQTHLVDYEVTPLFPQLGRPGLEVVVAPGQTTLVDLRGHMVGAFALRRQVMALGYGRGSVVDGGQWFLDYRKPFPSLGLVAVIGFTGNVLPEEDRVVALTDLRVERDGQPVALDEVPARFLGELHADAVRAAAAGSGYDEAWQTRVRW